MRGPRSAIVALLVALLAAAGTTPAAAQPSDATDVGSVGDGDSSGSGGGGAGNGGGAAAGPSTGAGDAPGKHIPNQYVVFYKPHVRGIRDVSVRLVDTVGARLAADASATAAVASLRAAGRPSLGTAAALRRPVSVLYATPYEVDPRGQWIVGTHAVVNFNRRLSGRSARVDLTERIMALIKEDENVAYVIKDRVAEMDAKCGKAIKLKCKDMAAPCCRLDGQCGTGDDYCGDKCMADWGNCTTPTVPREHLLNADIVSGPTIAKQPNMAMIEGTTIDVLDNNKQWVPMEQPRIKNTPTTAYNTDFQVMILDSGVGPHIDINRKTCRNFNPSTLDADQGNPKVCKDKSGHGTHVAGIVGARNNGVKSWGVAPGVKIFAAATYNWQTGAGGPYSAFLEALRYVQANNDDNKLGLKVAVVNMSFGLEINPKDPDDKLFATSFCALVDQISATYGTVFVASAGNSHKNIPFTGENSAPKNCDTPIVVTNLDSCTVKTVTDPVTKVKSTQRRCFPHWSSNFVDPTLKRFTDAYKAKVVAAPGTDVQSTLPNNDYGLKTGTSMASPHVAGIVARCFMAGDCVLGVDGLTNRNKVLDSFRLKNTGDPSYQWSDALDYLYTFPLGWSVPPNEGKTVYLGPIAWAGHW